MVVDAPVFTGVAGLQPVNCAVPDAGHVSRAKDVFLRTDAYATRVLEKVDCICGVAVGKIQNRVEQFIISGPVDLRQSMAVCDGCHRYFLFPQERFFLVNILPEESG